MARALIVGCGRLGAALGQELSGEGWAVRGTSREESGAERISQAGLEGAVADPDRVGTVLEHVADVTVVVWALGGATGDTATDVNGPRLERMLERLVDTPVRGFVLDPPTDGELRGRAIEATRYAHETWRIPVRVLEADRAESEEWIGEAVGAVRTFVE